MSQKPETVFRERVRSVLKKLQKEVPLYFESIAQKGKSGTPDFFLCCNGAFIALELKKDAASKPTPLQAAKLQQVVVAKGIALVMHPGNFEETIMAIRSISRSKR